MTAEIETPLTVGDVSKLTGLSRRIVTQLFEREPGVIIYDAQNARRKRKHYRSIRIPRRVFERVLRRHTVQ
jgi:hypothetical protein